MINRKSKTENTSQKRFNTIFKTSVTSGAGTTNPSGGSRSHKIWMDNNLKFTASTNHQYSGRGFVKTAIKMI
jgi:hypothetical protein